MAYVNIPWSDELVAKTKPLYEAGRYSNAEIGRMVGKTRNSIIGKANRDGWINPNPQKGGVKPGEKRPRAAKGWSRKSAISIAHNLSRVDPGEAALPKQITPPEFLGLALLELPENACHYIPGSDRLYCGQPTDGESPYCNWCRKLMYTPHAVRAGHMKLPPMNGRQ